MLAVLTALGLVGAGCVATVAALRAGRRTADRQHWQVVTGTVVDVRAVWMPCGGHAPGSTAEVVEVAYVGPDDLPHRVRVPSPCDGRAGLRTGDSLPVRVDPHDAARAAVVTERRARGSDPQLLTLGLAVVIAGLGLALLHGL